MSRRESGRQPNRLVEIDSSFIAPSSQREAAHTFREECSRYQIEGRTIPLENLSDNYVERHYQTIDEGNWTVRMVGFPKKNFPYVNGNFQQMQRLEQQLAERQSLRLPRADADNEKRHARGMHFVAGNLEIIDELLTNGQNRKGGREPLFFVESEIPHPDKGWGGKLRTDIVIVGSDNKVRILEFGNGIKKPDRAQTQAEGILRLYKDINGIDLPASRVISHVVQYRMDADMNELSIYPPKYLQNRLDDQNQVDGIYRSRFAYQIPYD